VNTIITVVVAALIERDAQKIGRVTVTRVDQIDAKEFFLW
jgi:hypothetical protein